MGEKKSSGNKVQSKRKVKEENGQFHHSMLTVVGNIVPWRPLLVKGRKKWGGKNHANIESVRTIDGAQIGLGEKMSQSCCWPQEENATSIPVA